MYRMHTECLYDRQEQRCKDQDCRRYIHKGSGDQKDHIHDQQDQEIVVRQSQQCRGNRLRDLHKCHYPAKNIGYSDQKYHHAAHFRAAHHNLPEGFQRDVAVKNPKYQGVDHCDR